MRHPLGRLALLHPFPSALNAALVAVLVAVAGGTVATAAVLALAMLALQVSIGALNDLADVAHDRVARPTKPIPAGLVSEHAARVVAVGAAAAGLVLASWVGPGAALLGAAGLGCGVAYDLWLKHRGLGWIAFSAAFPILLLFAWVGAGAGLPPGWPTLLPVAALAGPALHLANALTDLDDDRLAGVDGLAVRLGRRRALLVMAALLVAVHALAWWTLLADDPPAQATASAGIATGAAVVGLSLSAAGGARATAWGWTVQCLAIALLAVAWLMVAAG